MISATKEQFGEPIGELLLAGQQWPYFSHAEDM